jgi:hypothetical protein
MFGPKKDRFKKQFMPWLLHGLYRTSIVYGNEIKVKLDCGCGQDGDKGMHTNFLWETSWKTFS